VNVSPLQLRNRDFVPEIEHALSADTEMQGFLFCKPLPREMFESKYLAIQAAPVRGV
jgi:EAL domain-containing protein (putative c-di-GMP-specific phosphodiesterase class I)